MNGRRAALYSLGLILAMAGQGLADGVIRDGVGARSSGRGGTNIAFADNGEVLLDNPAGIVNTECCGLAEIGFDLLLTDLQYSDGDNRRTDAANSPFPMGQLSYLRKSRDGRWAFGFGGYSQAGFATHYDLVGPAPFPEVHHYKSIGALAKFLPGVAYRVTDRLSVGATLGVAVNHVELEGPYFLQAPGPFQQTPMLLDLQATGAAPAWSVGLQYEISEATTVGLSYQGQSSFELDGVTRVDVPGLGQSKFDTRFDITWPQSLGLGIKHRLCPHRTVSADVIWFDWSSAFDQFGLEYTQPTNPVFAAVIGPRLRETFPLHWRDTVSVRVGYEQTLWMDHVIRFGYAHHPNPIPLGEQTPFIQAFVQHVFSVGYGLPLRRWDFDAAYQFTFGPDRVVSDSDFVGGDFDGSRHEAQAHWLMFSLTRRF